MDLVGVAELAARAGVARDTVRKWRQRHADFPPPLITIGGVPIWEWPTVAEWLARPRPPGRPSQKHKPD